MALQWRDSAERYGLVTRVLHWAIAALVLWQLLGMVLKITLGRVPLAGFFVGLHQPVGATLFTLIVLRVLWALASRRSRPPHAPGLMGHAARAGHLALYVLMLAIPSLGLLRAWGEARAFTPFGIPVFPAREEPVGWAVNAANLLHGELGWLLVALVLGHVVMALLHEALWRDGTMARMAGRRRGRPPAE